MIRGACLLSLPNLAGGGVWTKMAGKMVIS